MNDKFTPYERKLLDEIAKLEADLEDAIEAHMGVVKILQESETNNQKLRDFVKDIAENGYRYGGAICQMKAEKCLKALEDKT